MKINEIIPGPSIKNDFGKFQLNEIGIKYLKEYKTFSKCFNDISNYIFTNLYEIGGDNEEYDNEKLKQKLDEKENKIINGEKYYEVILLKKSFIFNLFVELDKIKTNQLSYTNIDFIKKDWISNDNLINNYPSFFFWLCKNDNYLETL